MVDGTKTRKRTLKHEMIEAYTAPTVDAPCQQNPYSHIEENGGKI